MKKFFIQFFAVLFSLLSLSVFVGCDTPFERTLENQLDMYLIAGQSNACGYTPYLNKQTEKFDNVWYAGMTDKQFVSDKQNTGFDNLFAFDAYFPFVQAGCGTNANFIGPEYGMAKVFNDKYQDQTKAFIFKTGAGGTSIHGNVNSVYGNWYPKSLWPEGYTPNITTPSSENNPMGILYHLFVENFRSVYNTLKENGYNPVVKGMAWMQGEQDLSMTGLMRYRERLSTFISDLRTDLVEITGDKKLKTMPFVIGKVSPSFWNWNNQFVPAMDMAQDMVAEELENVVTISVSDLYITDKNDNPIGPDRCHYSFKDMVTLGERFGNALLEMKTSGFLGF